MNWYAELRNVFSSNSLATIATSATREQLQDVTYKKGLATRCDTLRHENPNEEKIPHVAVMSQDVAESLRHEETLFYQENKQFKNICRNVANVAEVKNSKTPHEGELWYMAQPQKCNKCLHWTPKKDACYWMRTCQVDGDTVSINSKCRIFNKKG